MYIHFGTLSVSPNIIFHILLPYWDHSCKITGWITKIEWITSFAEDFLNSLWNETKKTYEQIILD